MVDALTGLFKARSAKAAGAKARVFDWDKAARIILERGAAHAAAGLSGDWEYTGGDILSDGKPIPRDETYVYLGSLWATPELEIGDDRIPCWRFADDTPGWNESTYWPDSAVAILEGRQP